MTRTYADRQAGFPVAPGNSVESVDGRSKELIDASRDDARDAKRPNPLSRRDIGCREPREPNLCVGAMTLAAARPAAVVIAGRRLPVHAPRMSAAMLRGSGLHRCSSNRKPYGQLKCQQSKHHKPGRPDTHPSKPTLIPCRWRRRHGVGHDSAACGASPTAAGPSACAVPLSAAGEDTTLRMCRPAVMAGARTVMAGARALVTTRMIRVGRLRAISRSGSIR